MVRAVAEQVWAMGHAAICPHLNSAFMDGIAPDQVFLDGDLKILKKCDAVVLVDGWERSKGATAEVLQAMSDAQDVFRDVRSFSSGDCMTSRQVRAVIEGKMLI